MEPGTLPSPSRLEAFRVTSWVRRCGGFVANNRDLWIHLAKVETKLRAADIEDVAIDRPVFVCGLARAGTTILLETLARHRQLGSHRYSDNPFVFTPIFWNRFLARLPTADAAPVERAHADGIAVTPESPEAFEEMIWMAFFSGLHDPGCSAVLDGGTHQPDFEHFLRSHIRKLLWVRGRPRYLSKANYHVTRLEYLLKLFPDARFVLPVRRPSAHIASLMKQHRLFCAGEECHPDALDHMRRIGHFEFGLDRRPINVGDGAMPKILAAFQRGEEVLGWALYWASLHRFLADRLQVSEALRAAVHVVRFEDLCEKPTETLTHLFAHCELPGSSELIAGAAEGLHAPVYYRPDFSAADLETIGEVTAAAARRFGYAEP
jgi:hypothetical protein